MTQERQTSRSPVVVRPAATERPLLLPAAALVLGALGDLLMRGDGLGLDVTLWAAAFAAAFLALRRAGVVRTRRAWPVVGAAVAAAGFAWRGSPALGALFVLLAGALMALAFLERPARAGILAWAAAALAAAVSAATLAIAALVDTRRPEREGGTRGLVGAAARGTLLAAPLLLAFGVLFASADPVFRAGLEALDLETVAGHVALAFLFAWLAAGTLRGLDVVTITPDVGVRRPARGPGREVAVALLLLDLLFLAFLAVQAGSLFRGHAFVESTTGLGYAEYARHGFFQLVAVGALALPALLAAEWAVPPEGPERRSVVALAGALTAMVGAVLGSAAWKMGLYLDAYGLTLARIYASAFLVWLALVLGWLGWTALRGARERLPAGAFVAGAGIVALLAAVNPEALVVRVNAERDAAGVRPFDARYAADLGSDAVPALVAALPGLPRDARCRVARDLVEWIDPGGDWRGWSLARERAVRAVGENEARVRRAAAACPVTPSRPAPGTGSAGTAVPRDTTPRIPPAGPVP